MAENLLADIVNMNAKAKTIKEIMSTESKLTKQTSNLFKGLNEGWQGSDEETLKTQADQLVKYMNEFNTSLEKMSNSIKKAGSQLSSKDSAAAAYFRNLY